MRKLLLIIAILILLVVVASNSFVAVDPTAYAYVTTFGRHVVTYDGGDNNQDTGLHLRLPWPIQSVQRLDRRLQIFDLSGIELLTRDRASNTVDKTLTLDAYVCWRIDGKDGVDQFIRTVGTPDRAKAILGQQISSQLAAEVNKLSMDDLISTQTNVADKLKELRQRLLDSQQPRAAAEYGIHIEDIRLRRFNYPPQVQNAIFERIRSERDAKAANYRRQGVTEKAAIESAAKKQQRIIIADAQARADRLRGEAVASADRIRNQAHRKQRDFYMFLKKLEDYARILGSGKTVLYLSTQREMFDVLLNPNGNSSSHAKPSNQPVKQGRN